MFPKDPTSTFLCFLASRREIALGNRAHFEKRNLYCLTSEAEAVQNRSVLCFSCDTSLHERGQTSARPAFRVSGPNMLYSTVQYNTVVKKYCGTVQYSTVLYYCKVKCALFIAAENSRLGDGREVWREDIWHVPTRDNPCSSLQPVFFVVFY